MDEEYMDQEYEADVEASGPSFAEAQQEWQEMQELSKSTENDYDKVVVESSMDPEQANRVKELRSRIAAIREEVKRTGRYFDKDENRIYEGRQVEKKIRDIENEIYKTKGYPWFERNSSNPLEAILKYIIRSIMYLLDGEYRRAKNNALEREDDSMRGQMDIRLTNLRRAAEREISEYLNENTKTTSRDDRAKDGISIEDGPVSTVTSKDEEQVSLDELLNGLSEGHDAASGKDDDMGIEDLLNDLARKANEEKTQKTAPENDTKPKKTDVEIYQKRSRRIQAQRNEYCLKETGKKYSELSLEEKAQISAKFIILEKHEIKRDDEKSITKPNYSWADKLEPEIVNSKEYAEQLMEAMKDKLPDKAKKYYEKNTIEKTPIVAAYLADKVAPETKNQKIAEMIIQNPKVLQQLPAEYINENITDIASKYKQALVDRHIEDQERETRHKSKAGDKEYTAPNVTKYLDAINTEAERRDKDIKDMESKGIEVTDKSNICKIFAGEVYTAYWISYLKGENMNFHDETALENDSKAHVTLYDDVIYSDECMNRLDEIARDPADREYAQELIKSTVSRIDRELEITPETEEDRKDYLENEKEALEDLLGQIEMVKEEEKGQEEPVPTEEPTSENREEDKDTDQPETTDDKTTEEPEDVGSTSNKDNEMSGPVPANGDEYSGNSGHGDKSDARDDEDNTMPAPEDANGIGPFENVEDMSILDEYLSSLNEGVDNETGEGNLINQSSDLDIEYTDEEKDILCDWDDIEETINGETSVTEETEYKENNQEQYEYELARG